MNKQNRADKRKFHFIYKTTCKVNSKYYLGMHSTNDLGDGYIGSGTRLWHSIKKHGRENFSIEILEHLPDRESLRKRESELINEEILIDPLCMNIKLGGEGGWDHVNKIPEAKAKGGRIQGRFNFRYKRSETHIKDIRSRNAKMWSENKEVISIRLLHASEIAASLKSIEKRKNTFSKIQHQQGSSNSQSGTMWITNGINSKKIKKTDSIETGWKTGRVQSKKNMQVVGNYASSQPA